MTMITYNDNNQLIREDDDKILKNLASPSMLSTGSVMLAGLGGAGPLSFPGQRDIDGNDDDNDDDDHDDGDNDDDDHDDDDNDDDDHDDDDNDDDDNDYATTMMMTTMMGLMVMM